MNLAQLLHTVAAGDAWPLEEALFLTFGFDSGFFERGILGRCRAAGAVVTVIADGTVWAPDPIALRSAGQEYLLGLAATPRAFHPKLMLLQGGDGALAAIGSGNLTTSGWQYNTELWRCLEATAAGAPTQPLLELAEWLDQLTTTATLAGPHRDAVHRSTDRLLALLTRVPEQSSTVRVLPLDRPVIEGLPQGPVDELLLAAPFIDPAADAIHALLKRLQPRQATIVLQEHRGVFDPATLTSVLAAATGSVTVIADRSTRYRHAKLIEWRTGTQRWALTGSANLTGSALLRPPGRGGNIELTVLEELTKPVWPPTAGARDRDREVVTLADLPAPAEPHKPTATATPAGLPLLLSVVWEGRDLDLELSKACPPEVEVQSRNHPIDGEWRSLGAIPVGVRRHHLPGVGVDDVAHLRLSTSGVDLVVGQPVPVTNLPRATQPPLLGPGQRRRISTAEDLLGDDLGYLAAFADQLTALANERRRASPATTRSATAVTERVTDPDDTQGVEALWRWEKAARGLHGPALTGFALGLPPAAPGDAWEDFDTPVGELATDSAITSTLSETISDDTDNEPVDHRHQQPAMRRARRHWVHGYADLAHRENRNRLRTPNPASHSQLSTLSWLAVTRLALVFSCAGNWPDDDETPAQHLAELLTTLLAGASAEDHLDEAVALAAVAVAVVRQRAGTSATGPVAVAARRVEAAAQPVLTQHQPTPALLAEYCRCLRTPAGLPLAPETVDGQLDAWLHHPLHRAIQLAQTRGWDCVEASSQLLQVTGTISDPITAALALLAGSTGPLAIDARSATRPLRGITIWASPDLYTIRLQPKPLWEHYTHPNIEAIQTSWSNGERSRYRQAHGPTQQPITAALQWLDTLGIDLV
ncbi:hypothetical protein GCM10009714_03850 [Microlunatus capsulatus]